MKSSSAQIKLQNAQNLELIYAEPLKEHEIYATKRYYFKILSSTYRLPDASIMTPTYTAYIHGITLTAKRLNPPKNFCNVLAHSLQLLKYESVQYNRELNLIVMKLRANVANLKEFSLPMAKREGIKKYESHFPQATLLYYAMIPKNITKLKFSYFDVVHKEFRTRSLPILVRDESVSTQSDIKPTEDKNKKIKILLFGSLGALLILYFLFKKSWLALLFGIAALVYMAYLMIPIKKVCVRQGAKIYILPTKQSTIFKINSQTKVYEELNRVNNYVKIKLSKERIGWVRYEDLCKN